MKEERRIRWNNLVHDVTDDHPKTDGIETGCGVVLQAKPELITEDATSCLTCISDNVNFERMLDSMKFIREAGAMGTAMANAFVDTLGGRRGDMKDVP